MYTVQFSDSAFRMLQKLERQTQERITSALERIRIRPESYVERLVGDSSYKLRAGDYRLILDIQQEVLTILVIKIGHRSIVYKR
jgi:mRNA interferase RelE/StbE